MLTATSYLAYLKRIFPNGFIDNSFTNVKDKMWSDIEKDTGAGGDLLTYLFDADDSFTAAGDLATSQATSAAINGNVGSQYQFPFVEVSDEAQMTAGAITKSQNSDSAWQQIAKTAMKKKLNGLNHMLALQLVGQGWGEIGQITSVSTNTFKLAIPSRIVRVVSGMPLLFAPDLNVSACRSPTPIYVSSVDLDNNLVTCSANLSVPGGVNNDFVFLASLRPTGAPGGVRGNCLVGLDAHFPDRSSPITDTTVSTLGSINRANNPRLYGVFVDASTGGSVLAALISATQKAATIGGATDLKFYCSQAVYAGVALDLQNPTNYEGNPVNKKVGTSSVVFYSNGTTQAELNVTKMVDDTVIFGLEKGAVELVSFGQMPKVDKLDGLMLARLASTQGYGTRFYGLGALKVSNPTACVRIKLA